MSPTRAAERRDDIERFLNHRVAEILGVPLQSLQPSTALTRLGMDSMRMLQLVDSIEGELRCELPRVARLDELTIESLAGLLENGDGYSITQSNNGLERMEADSILPDDIRPSDVGSAFPRTILLTGATGFLGGYLLRSFLRTTDARVLCLARSNHCDVRGRIRDNLGHYGIWETEFDDRIEVMAADLSQPRIGLSPLKFDALADSIDAIVHPAASVNWVQPYASLRASNVLAVKELLRLACRGRAKPFNFVSTMGVCFSTIGQREIDESGGSMEDLGGIHLPYAQSKLVAETLVRQAADRGLPVSIFRSSFISGDSISGASNTADFISSFIKGCVRMGAAPDLDWRMDSLPVDYAADVISRLAFPASPLPFRVFHLANPKVRHWRELVLWMNLYGYAVDLISYEDWASRLQAETRLGNDPLRGLAPFFLRRVDPLYLPQLYEESRKRRVRSAITEATLVDRGFCCPGLSARLIDRYFSYFVESRFLPPVASNANTASCTSEIHTDFFNTIFGGSTMVSVPVEFTASDSVIGELTSWKYGPSIGLHAYRIELRSGGLGPSNVLDVVVKIQAKDTEVIEVGTVVAALCDPELGDAYARYPAALGLSGSDTRELGAYSQEDGRFRRHTPYFHGGLKDGGRTILVFEKLSEMEMMNSTDRVDSWRPAHIEAAIEGIAQIHSIWYRRESELLNQPWLGHVPTGASMREAGALWPALGRHANPIFTTWAGPKFGALQNEVLENMNCWWAEIEAMPRTLIHNDCNPRNLAFRRAEGQLRLCLYDWELATLGLPQHDLAELLCFVLGPCFNREELHGYVECHRMALERASGHTIDRAAWFRGFRLCLYDLMINRLPVYAMIHRFQHQRFLERVVRTWVAIHETL